MMLSMLLCYLQTMGRKSGGNPKSNKRRRVFYAWMRQGESGQELLRRYFRDCKLHGDFSFFTLPETHIFAPENRPLEKEIPIGNPPFSGAMLVSGSVSVVGMVVFWNVLEIIV